MTLSKNLLWIDCSAGALAGVLILAFSGWLSAWYNVPRGLLLFMGAANILYACYSCSLSVRKNRPALMIKILIIANSFWAMVCLGIVSQYYEQLSSLGYLHLLAEAIFVGGLALLEWKWRDQLLIR